MSVSETQVNLMENLQKMLDKNVLRCGPLKNVCRKSALNCVFTFG